MAGLLMQSNTCFLLSKISLSYDTNIIKANNMKCTECYTETNNVHTDSWSSKHGQIIRPDEKLCNDCASKRTGFATLSDINIKLLRELHLLKTI